MSLGPALEIRDGGSTVQPNFLWQLFAALWFLPWYSVTLSLSESGVKQSELTQGCIQSCLVLIGDSLPFAALAKARLHSKEGAARGSETRRL